MYVLVKSINMNVRVIPVYEYHELYKVHGAVSIYVELVKHALRFLLQNHSVLHHIIIHTYIHTYYACIDMDSLTCNEKAVPKDDSNCCSSEASTRIG
jgi:S-adenosylmethionine/arginine decarboxylase-like enzyme